MQKTTNFTRIIVYTKTKGDVVLFGKRRCKHKNLQTITNICGDPINKFNARSIKNCIDCGKIFFDNKLDKNCKKTNIFNYHEFHLMAESIDEVSDGFHTFNELYYHRMILFAIICNTYKENAWKSWKHSDNTMYKDYFIVGITTPVGDYSYHYHKKYWNKFSVKELDTAPKWDGHLPEDIERLFTLLK